MIASVLRIVATSLENSLRPTDFLGRLSESRFLAILTECGGAELPKAAERIRKTISGSEVAWWGDRWPVAVSIGGACAIPADTLDSLLARGTKALERSIEAGGNRVTTSIFSTDLQFAREEE